MIIPIRTWPDKILTTTAKTFEFNLPEQDMTDLESAMIETMLRANGIGLAANQVGFTERFFAQRLSSGKCYVAYNPKIIDYGTDEKITLEGCLSFPELGLPVSRHHTIKVEYQDRHGILHTEELSGWDARCFQHELDHLNGIVFTDRTENDNYSN